MYKKYFTIKRFSKFLIKIIPFLFIILFFSFFFDIGMTYYNYKTDYNMFINSEANHSLVGELKEGVSFYKSNILCSILLVYSTLIFYFLYVKNLKYKYVKLFCLTGLYFILLIQISKHIIGGISWL